MLTTSSPITRTPSPQVSIVIAARNNGHFLTETLCSAFAQTVPCEVIYADDASIDDSLAIARGWEARGLVIVRQTVHRGVCAARNLGAAVARGNFLVFLDGDDRLPKGYVARHLEEMTPETPFVYGPARAFGSGPHAETLWSAPAWCEYDRWRCNTVNTSALYARWAFLAAGGWSDRVPTMWDWDLALRAARFGTPQVSTAVLEYRQHDESWSAQILEKEQSRGDFLALVRRRNARLAVGAILSGRLPALFPRWLDALATAVRRIDAPEPPSLILLDNSRDPEFRELVERELPRYSETFRTQRVTLYPATFSWTTEKERRDRVAMFLAQAYQRLSAEMAADVHWLVEDDVLVPLDGGVQLWLALTGGATLPHGVSGCYRNRHDPDRYVGGWWRSSRAVEPNSISREGKAFEVDFVGTGCLMYWPSRTPDWIDSHARGIPAHDWAWSARVKENSGRLLFHPAVRCQHAVDEITLLDG